MIFWDTFDDIFSSLSDQCKGVTAATMQRRRRLGPKFFKAVHGKSGHAWYFEHGWRANGGDLGAKVEVVWWVIWEKRRGKRTFHWTLQMYIS